MEQNYEPTHAAKPKIAKNASSKLPDVFFLQATVKKNQDHPLETPQQSNREHKQQSKQGHKEKEGKDRQGKDIKVERQGRKSKNPFLPIKQYFKKVEQFAKQMREANLDFNVDRLAKYSFEEVRGRRIKYENCLTLSVIRKSATGCLKKVLYVPTLSIHFLRESLISAHIDKNQLVEWMSVNNKVETAPNSCVKIVQLFWNMPEDYYSLLYEYHEGVLLDSLLDSLNSLPSALTREIAAAHLGANIGIFNSQLILSEEAGKKIIKYLPLYEENDSVWESKKMKEIMDREIGVEEGEESTERKLTWRLGLITVVSAVGLTIFNQDVGRLQLPLKRCCLFHEILALDFSLTNLYLSVNGLEDEVLLDFFCNSLRSKRVYEENTSRVDLRSLREHKWLKRKYQELVSLGQLISVVDPSSKIKSKFEISKMNKILDSMGLILQNVSGIAQVSLNSQNKAVTWLAKELGMANEVDKVIKELRKVYKNQK